MAPTKNSTDARRTPVTNRKRAARLVYGDNYPAEALARRLAQFDEDVSMGEKRALAMKGVLDALDEKDAECERRVAEERQSIAATLRHFVEAGLTNEPAVLVGIAESLAPSFDTGEPVSPAPQSEPVATGEAPSPRVPREVVVEAFPVGARVRKRSGYRFEGVVLGAFTKRDGSTRFANVENDDGWVMHFREADLEAVTPGQGQGGAK